MPTLVRKNGSQIIILINDHLPMHVHVFKAEGELIVNLGDEQKPAAVRDNFGMRRSDVRQALKLVNENHNLLAEKCRGIHG
ncbi:MAG: DUF4160 domain-containing protein [Pyrinomonadaceae bacterium]|nr:DUF4160 domain-containing protein [Pyrinomonadaceae bacterium]